MDEKKRDARGSLARLSQNDDFDVIDRVVWPLALLACAVGMILLGYVSFSST